MSITRWTRPDDFPYPHVWRLYEGKREIEGKKPKFRIQDATEEYHEEIIEHMTKYFLKDEPMCRSLALADDPVSVKEFQDLWRNYLNMRIALVAIVDPETTTYRDRVAGCNILGIIHKTDDTDSSKMKGEPVRKMIKALECANDKAKMFERFEVDYYMYAIGLSVAHEYRGQGLGFEIIKTRFDLGRALRIGVTSTLFTPLSSQWFGAQCGMETIVEINYEDYKDEEGHVVFKGIANKSMKLMARRI